MLNARQHYFWGMWCICSCHLHLTRTITWCTAVWAQACGLERRSSFSHHRASLVHPASQWFFPLVTGVLVGEVSRYCHFWYRSSGPSQPQQFFQCAMVNTLQYHDTVGFGQDSETEDPQQERLDQLEHSKQLKRDLKQQLKM